MASEQLSFRLPADFVQSYLARPSPFGFNGLGELVYQRTYSRVKSDGSTETWPETVERVVNGAYTMQKDHVLKYNLGWDEEKGQKSAREMYDRIFNLKFTPPGRGLWTAGTDAIFKRGLAAALNNCFSGDTKFFADGSLVRFDEAVGLNVDVLCKDGVWREAEVQEFGVQPLQEVTFGVPTRSNYTFSYKVTPNHRWLLADGTETTALKVGDRVRATPKTIADLANNDFRDGFIHGCIYADGTKHTYYHNRFIIRLCGKKNEYLDLIKSKSHLEPQVVENGDRVVTIVSDRVDYKALPLEEYSADYKAGFVRAWSQFDGWSKPSGSVCLDTSNIDAANWVVSHANALGYTVTGWGVDKAETNYGPRSAPLNRISIKYDAQDYVVREINPLPAEKVYCVVEPITHTFTLEYGLPTGNCAFVSTEHIDAEHSKPFRFLMDMSMLGVGVGFDTKGAGKALVQYTAKAHHKRKFEKIDAPTLNGMVLNRCRRYTNALETTLRDKNPEKSNADIKAILDKYLYSGVARLVGQHTADVAVALATDTSADHDEEIADIVDKRVYQLVMQVLIDKCNETITKTQNQIAAMDLATDGEKIGSLQWTISSLQNDIAMYNREIAYVDGLGDRKVKFVEIDDDREGWVDSLTHLVDSYLKGGLPVVFVYSKIRPAGLLLKTFGGLSSGPEPLIDMHLMLRQVFERNAGRAITVTTIVDVMNLIGKAVVAGNVRRSSEIALGEPNSAEFLNLKNYGANPERAAWGWCSNNSLYAEIGMDYTDIARRINDNGEPGLFWLENARDYSRMGHQPDFKDKRAAGTNPCSEQTLESYELCCLVEVFPARHENLKDFLRTLKFAYLYAKTVTLGNSHWAETNRVMMRNRRIGCSLSGIAQFLAKNSLHSLREWCQLGYDEIQNWDRIYSEYLAIPRSVKTTSIKPSGSVSLLAGATPGVHFPISRCYIRRMRLMKDSHLVKPLLDAGYHVEPCIGSEKSTVVVEIPIKLEDGIRTCDEVSIWEKMELTAFIQEHWADNQVSVTVDYDLAKEGDQVKPALEHFQYRMKSVSFLPRKGNSKPYPQMPYESIDEATYRQRVSKIRPLNFAPEKKSKDEEVEVDTMCDGERCVLAPKRAKHDK